MKCRDLYRGGKPGKQFTPPGCPALRQDRLTEDRRTDSHRRQTRPPDPHESQDRVRKLRIRRRPDSGLHDARQQRQRRELGSRVRVCSRSAAPTSAPSSGPTRSANTRPPSAVDPKSGETHNNLAVAVPADRPLQGGRRRGEGGRKGRVQGAPAAQAGHQGQAGRLTRCESQADVGLDSGSRRRDPGRDERRFEIGRGEGLRQDRNAGDVASRAGTAVFSPLMKRNRGAPAASFAASRR